MATAKTKNKRETFTREELLAALTLEPCHTTGMHDPTHTPRFICEFQKTEALDRLLALLGVKLVDLPRRLHPDRGYGPCSFCHVYDRDGELAAWAGGALLKPRKG